MSFEKKHFYTRCAGLSGLCAPYSIYLDSRRLAGLEIFCGGIHRLRDFLRIGLAGFKIFRGGYSQA